MLLSTFYYPSLSLYHQFYMNMNNGFKGKLSMNKQKCLEVANNIEKSWIADFKSQFSDRYERYGRYKRYMISYMCDLRHLRDQTYERSDIWEIQILRDQRSERPDI